MPRDINELPNNPDAENGLIGLTLVKGYIPFAARGLTTTDFYDRRNRDTWSAFLELAEENRTIEPMSAADIIKRNTNTPISASELLATTTGMTATHENVYVEKIRNASMRRILISKLHDGIQGLVSGDKDIISRLKREFSEIGEVDTGKGAFVSMAEVVEWEVKPALEDLSHGVTSKIPTGWDAIDRAIGGGLSLSDVVLVAGLPGGGKSAFVLQLASNFAKLGYPVAFVSGEMSNRENGLRLLSQLSGTQNLNSLTHIAADERDFLLKWADEMAKLPIEWNCTTYDLRTLSRNIRALSEQGVKVLVIDYIQLYKLDKLSKNQRTERIAETSQEVKRIAMEFGIAVIEVAQFNREGAKSGKPTMQDLEGSSQLEKDTSLIFIIDQIPESQEVALRIVKGRNTGTSTISGVFAGWKLTFNF